VLSGLIGLAPFAVVAVTLALLWLYSARLKGMFLVGNIVVSILGGLGLVYGSLAIDHVSVAVLSAAAIVTVLIFAREVLKCVEDYEGDVRAQLNTIAVVIGRQRALDVFTLMTVVGIAAIPLYIVAYHPTSALLLLGGLGVSLVLTVTLLIARKPSPLNLRRGVLLTKTSLYLGMFVLFLSRLPAG
jgi:4-hydroxybenzoate polyprenyltransferase